MTSRPLKAIFFDIDDTLFSTTEFAEKARKESIARMIRYGLKVSEKDALYELREVINEFSSNYDKHFDKLLRLAAPVLQDPLKQFLGHSCLP